MSDALLEDLLADAKKVAHYCSCSGRLTDARLSKAIEAAEKDPDLDWSKPAAAELQAALAAAVDQIHPVSLIDLKSGWDPFSPRPWWRRFLNPARIFYVVLALALIGVAQYYTQWQQRAEAVIALYEVEDVRGQLFDTINEISDEFLTETAPDRLEDLDDPAGFSRTALREKMRELQVQTNAYHTAQNRYNSVIERFWRLPGVVIEPWSEKVGLLTKDYDQYKQDSTRRQGAPPRANDVEICLRAAFGAEPAVVGNAQGPSEPNPLQSARDLNRYWLQDTTQIQFIRCLVGAYEFMGVKYDNLELRQKVIAVSQWLLPAVFGAFGALIFQLRACLDRTQPDPRFGRAILRIFLGAFGGTAFSWLWVPGAEELSLPPTVPVGVYGMAFLIGYSIDIFFAIIDRSVAAIMNSVRRIDSGDSRRRPPPPPPAPPATG